MEDGKLTTMQSNKKTGHRFFIYMFEKGASIITQKPEIVSRPIITAQYEYKSICIQVKLTILFAEYYAMWYISLFSKYIMSTNLK